MLIDGIEQGKAANPSGFLSLSNSKRKIIIVSENPPNQ